jgi:hypothetical protein
MVPEPSSHATLEFLTLRLCKTKSDYCCFKPLCFEKICGIARITKKSKSLNSACVSQLSITVTNTWDNQLIERKGLFQLTQWRFQSVAFLFWPCGSISEPTVDMVRNQKKKRLGSQIPLRACMSPKTKIPWQFPSPPIAPWAGQQATNTWGRVMRMESTPLHVDWGGGEGSLGAIKLLWVEKQKK